ncbi:MAG: hypothetical protein Q4B86_03575 [Eubacteriales bacterium]|nr:hypothetical protein [Eubacteriales bacterium]
MFKNKFKNMLATGAILLALPINAYAALISGAKCTGLELTASGSAAWEAPQLQNEEVEKYEIRLSLMRNGTWDDDYKSYKTDSDSYEFNFTKTGKYKYRVRAKFYGGNHSEWSEASPVVIVTEDDLNFDNWDDDDFDEDLDPFDDIINNQNSNGNFGPGYRPDGSYLDGSNSYGYGPSGSITTVPYPGLPNNNNYNNGSPSATPNQGWVKGDAGWWYKYADGSYPRNSWQRINDKWYFFNMDGIMQTGWIWWNNCWYLALPDGSMATGWNNVNDRWYYLNPSGIMLTGYQIIDGKTYYLDATGARVSDGYSPDGHYFDKDGVMQK